MADAEGRLGPIDIRVNNAAADSDAASHDQLTLIGDEPDAAVQDDNHEAGGNEGTNSNDEPDKADPAGPWRPPRGSSRSTARRWRGRLASTYRAMTNPSARLQPPG
jgi:hypothetical protein